MVIAASACVLSAATASPSRAFESQVPERFFGISSPETYSMSLDGRYGLRDAAFRQFRDGGIEVVRTEVGWRDVETTAPVNGVHRYDWTRVDRHVNALASYGLTWMPNPHTPPQWAQSGDAADALTCGRTGGIAPEAVGDYVDFVEAFAKRYGRNGSFWANRPQLPYRPVVTYEIWNEPNWRYFWCPEIDPATYARALARAADAIHAVDPQATVALGGLVLIKHNRYDQGLLGGGLDGIATPRFLDRLIEAEPALPSKIDAVAVHAYRPDADLDVAQLGWIREQLDARGFADDALILSEFGWQTGALAEGSVTEDDRTELYRQALDQLPRLDCGLSAVFPHNWISRSLDPTRAEDWWGIADPQTAAPYASGRAYFDAIELFEGNGPVPPPTATIPVCTGGGEFAEPPTPFPPRVERSFFGVSTTLWPTPWEKRADFTGIDRLHLGTARQLVSWKQLERVSPDAPGHELITAGLDDQFTLFGLRGVGLSLAFRDPPDWTAGDAGGPSAAYPRFMAQVARRYGRGGSFWAESGNVDPALALGRYEVWTQANGGQTWWSGPDAAARYADLYLATRDALRAVDPEAEAMASLSATGTNGDASTFLRAMAAARPELAGRLDAVYVDAVQKRSVAGVQEVVTAVRAALDETGNRAAKIELGFGAPTQGANSLAEDARAAYFGDLAAWAARSDCGIAGIRAHAWTTPEADPTSPWHWYGIADPGDSSAYPTAERYGKTAGELLGLGPEAPPAGTLATCYPAPPPPPPPPPPGPGDPGPGPGPQPGSGLDQDPPALTVTKAPPKRSPKRKAKVRFELDDPTAAAEYRLDRRRWKPASSPLRLRVRPRRHKLLLRATDPAGNVSRIVKLKFRVTR